MYNSSTNLFIMIVGVLLIKDYDFASSILAVRHG